MKIWDVTFTNEDKEGSAVVSASTSSEAAIILQSTGRLNAGRYKVTSVNLIGCNNTNFKQIISENFCEPRIVRPSDDNNNSGDNGSDKPVSPDFIDNLTDEDIAKLRVKLNIQNNVLYVDRIGAVKKGNQKDGYLVFTTQYHPVDLIGARIRDEYTDPWSLYIKKDGEFINLGVPTQRVIMSTSRLVVLNPQYKRPRTDEYNPWESESNTVFLKDISFKKKPVGLFYRGQVTNRNRRSYNDRILNRRTWKFIDPYKKLQSEEYGKITVPENPGFEFFRTVMPWIKEKGIYSGKNLLTESSTYYDPDFNTYKCRVVLALGHYKKSKYKIRDSDGGGSLDTYRHHYHMKGRPIMIKACTYFLKVPK